MSGLNGILFQAIMRIPLIFNDDLSLSNPYTESRKPYDFLKGSNRIRSAISEFVLTSYCYATSLSRLELMSSLSFADIFIVNYMVIKDCPPIPLL